MLLRNKLAFNSVPPRASRTLISASDAHFLFGQRKYLREQMMSVIMKLSNYIPPPSPQPPAEAGSSLYLFR